MALGTLRSCSRPHCPPPELSHCPMLTLGPHYTLPPLPSPAPGSTIYSLSLNLTPRGPPVSGSTQDVSSCVWLVSLSTVSPRPTPAAAGIRMPDLFRAESYPTVWKYLPHSRIICRRHLGGFRVSAAVDSAPVDTAVRCLCGRVFLWGRHLGVRLLGQVAAPASPSEEPLDCLPRQLHI